MDYYRLLILLWFLWRMAYTTRNSDHRVSMVFLYLTLCSVACKLCKLQSLALHLWSITLSPSESQIVADVTGPGPSCRFETPSFGSGLVAPVLCQVSYIISIDYGEIQGMYENERADLVTCSIGTFHHSSLHDLPQCDGAWPGTSNTGLLEIKSPTSRKKSLQNTKEHKRTSSVQACREQVTMLHWTGLM